MSIAREMWSLGHVTHPVEALRYHERFWGWGAAKFPEELRKIEGKILGGEAELGELVRAHAMSVAQLSCFRPAGSAVAAAASFSAGSSAASSSSSSLGFDDKSGSLPAALRTGLPFDADLALQLVNGASRALGGATTVPPAPLVSRLHGGPVAYDGVPTAATAIDASPESDAVLLATAASIALRHVLPSGAGAGAGAGTGAGAALVRGKDTTQTETQRFLAALGFEAAPAAGGSPLGSAEASLSSSLSPVSAPATGHAASLRARLHQRMPADLLLDADGLRRSLLHTPALALDRYARSMTADDAHARYTALLRASEGSWEGQRRLERASREAERRARGQAFEDLAAASSFLERRVKSTRDSLTVALAAKPATAGSAGTAAGAAGAAAKPATAAAAKTAAAKSAAGASAATKPGAAASAAGAAKPAAKAAAKPAAGGAGSSTPTASAASAAVGQKRKAPDAASGSAAAGSASSAGAAAEDVVYFLGKTGPGSANQAGVKALHMHTLPALAKAIAGAGNGGIKTIETAYLAAVPEADKPSLRQLQATIGALAEKRKGTGWAVRSPYEGLADMTGEQATALLEKTPLKVVCKAAVKKPKVDAAAGATAGGTAASGSAASAASASSGVHASASPGRGAGAAPASSAAADVISIDE